MALAGFWKCFIYCTFRRFRAVLRPGARAWLKLETKIMGSKFNLVSAQSFPYSVILVPARTGYLHQFGFLLDCFPGWSQQAPKNA